MKMSLYLYSYSTLLRLVKPGKDIVDFVKFTTRFLIFCFLLVSSLLVQAQDFVDYGNLLPEEKQLKTCVFDTDADAVILMDEAVSSYNDDHNLSTERHIKIKILKEKGINAATISIPFYSKDDFEIIRDVEGLTFNENINKVYLSEKVDKKTIYTKKINENYGEVRFTFPSVRPGSILEYRYRSVMKHYGGLEDWRFQHKLPTLISKYKLFIVPNAEFAYQVQKSANMAITVKQDKRDGAIYFEMKNIPSLTEEPYMNSRNDYLQKVTFQLSGYNNGFGKSKYMTSWDELAKELHYATAFGGQLKKTISGTEDFLLEVKSISSLQQRVKKIYNYVRSNMSWNNFYGKYSIDGIKNAWMKKSGTNGEINLILINFLQHADIETYPVLVSERFNGKVNITYPFIDQFNTVFACVKVDGNYLYLDATDKFTPVHITPFDALNTKGIILKPKNAEIVDITNNVLYTQNNNIMLTVTTDGNATGTMFARSVDYSKITTLTEYSSNKDKFIDRYIRKSHEGITVTKFELENETNDSLPLIQKCEFSLVLNGNDEDYKFIPINLMCGLEKNPFVRDNRFSDINFGFNQKINFNTQIQLPENYIVDAMPKSVKLMNPEENISFVRRVYYDTVEMKIACMNALEIKKSVFTVDEYEDIKEFYKKMFSFLNEQIVLKKK